MAAYLSRRILATIPVMLFVALFVFSLLYIAPGDPAAIIAGDQASPADVERIRINLGLDRPTSYGSEPGCGTYCGVIWASRSLPTCRSRT